MLSSKSLFASFTALKKRWDPRTLGKWGIFFIYLSVNFNGSDLLTITIGLGFSNVWERTGSRIYDYYLSLSCSTWTRRYSSIFWVSFFFSTSKSYVYLLYLLYGGFFLDEEILFLGFRSLMRMRYLGLESLGFDYLISLSFLGWKLS